MPLLRAAGAAQREAIAYLCEIPEAVAEERELDLRQHDEVPRTAEEWMRRQFSGFLETGDSLCQSRWALRPVGDH